MEQKSIHIIETSIKLFAKKGFSSTSVQEIADECGMSKGAFYLHFKSKDALLLELFKYYVQRIQNKLNEVQAEHRDPRTTFTEQLRITLEEVAAHREFIIMQIREQAIPFNENVEEFLTGMRFDSYLFYKRHLFAIYGDELGDAAWEISLLLQGMFKSFMDLIIVENAPLDFGELSRAMLKRADYLIEGFQKHHDAPVISETTMNRIIPEDFYQQEQDELHYMLRQLEEQAEGEWKETITVLLEELQKKEPRRVIVSSMLSRLEQHDAYRGTAAHIKFIYSM
ncbi:TetR/AcrR family transcriptional regulator [Halobacillus fulvus]|nr:TetR/AcrR family transcriptional regulator [Halobacillus fulvus]